MTPLIVSIYQENVPSVIRDAQRRVMDTLAPGYEFRQILSADLPGRYAHAVGIDRVLAEDTDHDTFLFLDIDAIPLNPNIIPWLFDRASHGVLVGPAQRANHIDNGEHIYAAPSALAFSRELFVRAGSPSFDPTSRGDIGEELTYRCEERGIPVNLLLPTGSIGPMIWPLKGGMAYGHGTTYAGAIFHAFQIRFGVTQKMFIDKCREVCPEVSVAAIIVHRGEERLPLLRKAIDSLRMQDKPPVVVVVEQDAIPRCKGEIEPLVDRYLFARSDGPFRKAWAFNVAVKSVEADFVLLHDGDLAVPRDYISMAVREIGDADVSTPWSCIAHLSPESTESYPSGERVVIDRMDSDWNKGASTLVRRSWYIKHKGMDERFQGWGAEDDAFVAKAKALGKYVRAQRDACVTLDHLYHKPRVRQSSRTIDMGDEPAPQADIEQYWRNYNMLKDDYGDPGRIAEIVSMVDGWGDPDRFGDGSIVKPRHKICLNMIVKDESHVITRCLNSVKPFIDYWVIVDTGSTDETPTIIRDVMADVPGELFHKPWVDFAHNRNEAFELAKSKAEFIFTIDADEVLELPAGFACPALQADCYSNTVRYDGVYYTRRQLFRSSLPWKYQGVVHEYLDCDGPVRHEFINGVVTVVYHEGARSRDPDTYKKDSVLLEKALADDPANSRYAFYLAQSYRDSGRHEDAVEAYKRRAKMTPPDQETYHSLYQAGKLREGLGHDWNDVMADYLDAYIHAPYRAEPLYRIGLHYRAAGNHCLAELFCGRAAGIQMPPAGALFVEYEVYTHLAAIEYAVACYWLGNHQEAIRVNKLLLGRGLPRPELTQLVQANLKFSLDAVGATS